MKYNLAPPEPSFAICRHCQRQVEANALDAQYWEHEGRSHAFLDSGSNPILGVSFAADAPQALDVMISFLDDVFYQ